MVRTLLDGLLDDDERDLLHGDDLLLACDGGTDAVQRGLAVLR